jgi:RES domain-containing protein
MDYFRIIQRKHAGSPLGYGNMAGRWNPRNVPVIYACSAVSLSMTEYLCIRGTSLLSTTWSLLTYTIDIDIPSLEKDTLPVEWDSRPYPLTTQLFGYDWVRNQASVCLKVPSARLLLSAYPREHNLVINPFHPDFQRTVTVKSVEDLYFHLNEWATGDR